MDDTDIDLRNIAGLLRRQIRLIIITIVAVVGVALIGAFALTPIFSSSALILVDPSTKNLLDPEALFSSAGADSARIDTEVEILRSDSILLQVITSENLIGDAEFGPSIGWRGRILGFLRLADPQMPSGQDALNDTLSNLRNAITVQRRGTTYLISVQVRSANAEQAAVIANAITKAYISDQLNSKVGSLLASRDILQSRINDARTAIVTSENAFDAFIQNNIDSLANDPANSDLAATQRQIEALRAAKAASDQTLNAAQANLETANWEELVKSLQSDALAELDRQRQELATAIESAGQDSPTAVDLRTQLAQVEDRLKTQATSDVTALQAAITSTADQEQSLRESMRQKVLTSALSADVLAELYGMQQSAELARGQYQTLLTRVQDLDTQANLQIADSRVVSPALAPQSAAFPNRSLIVMVALLLGVALGVALAFLYENLIGGFNSVEQIESVLKTRVAAAIPRQTAKSANASLADFMVQEPLSLFAEAVRRIRVAINRPGASLLASSTIDGHTSQVIMVSSTAPNEGKTTIALALARSYALSGQSALIIDCDLRKPSVHRHLGAEKTRGLSEYLESLRSGPADLTSALSHDPLTELTAITGAHRSATATDQLLASRSFGLLIEAARRSFDVLILDTPPVGPVVDALYVAPFADSIVFVTKWGSTPQSTAKRAIQSLAESKRPETEIVTVLNQQTESRSAYYSKYGGYLSEAY